MNTIFRKLRLEARARFCRMKVNAGLRWLREKWTSLLASALIGWVLRKILGALTD
jgi:hypothetical protein